MPKTMNVADEFSMMKVGKSSLNAQMLNAFHPKHLTSGRLGDGFETPLFEPKLLDEKIKFSDDESGQDVIVQGDSFSDAAKSMAGSLALTAAGDAWGASFEGGLSASFKNKGMMETSTKMLKAERNYVIGSQKIGVVAGAGARKYLTEEARDVIDTMQPDMLYEQIGHYYATKLYFGGSYTLYASTESKEEMSSTDFAAAVNASVSEKISGSNMKADANVEGEAKSSGKTFKYCATQTVLGGQLGLFKFEAATGKELSSKEAEWCASVARSPVIVSAALAPIYELAEGARREELKKAFHETFGGKQGSLSLEKGTQRKIGFICVKSVESRGDTWNKAADGLKEKIKSAGVQRGQIISIDAHARPPIFSAHFSSDLPGDGPAEVVYTPQNSTYGWAEFYDKAAAGASDGIISITGSFNEEGKAVMYTWSYTLDGPKNSRLLTGK